MRIDRDGEALSFRQVTTKPKEKITILIATAMMIVSLKVLEIWNCKLLSLRVYLSILLLDSL